jgi:hypothetical protein
MLVTLAARAFTPPPCGNLMRTADIRQGRSRLDLQKISRLG